MEIKTCEEYVLAELNDYKEENAGLRKILAETPMEKCRNVSPARNTDMQNGMAQFRCSVCGCELLSLDYTTGVNTFGGFLALSGARKYTNVKYCPNCGRGVLQQDDSRETPGKREA